MGSEMCIRDRTIVEGFFGLCTCGLSFHSHLRDFQVQIKEVAGAEDVDDEREAVHKAIGKAAKRNLRDASSGDDATGAKKMRTSDNDTH